MSCPTCGHTTQGLGYGNFWCPRCGTLQSRETFAPALVGRIKQLHFEMDKWGDFTEGQCALWHRLGIPEAINLPGQRIDPPQFGESNDI